jgi:hypothetical protein
MLVTFVAVLLNFPALGAPKPGAPKPGGLKSGSIKHFVPPPLGFVAAGSEAPSGKRLVADQAVLAFAPTSAGRLLFTARGAFLPAFLAEGQGGSKKMGLGLSPGGQALLVFGAGFETTEKRTLEPTLARPLSGKLHFLLGPSEDWQLGCTSYCELVYPCVWPGIDLVFESRAVGLGYRLELAPGADVSDIVMTTGAERLVPQDDGSLRGGREGAWLRIGKPRAFQWIDGCERPVAVSLVPADGGRYRFALAAHDPQLPLIIAPSLTWSSYLGGTNADAAQSIAVDGSGAVYLAGYTHSSNFPTTIGAYDPGHNAYVDAFISKLSADGTSLVYSTFLGGSAEDYCYALAVDGTGAAYLTGKTDSNNFPTSVGAFDASYNGTFDAFVSKLSADGSSLEYSTYLGSSSVDAGYAIAVDAFGSACLTGFTVSVQISPFPTTAGAYDPSQNGADEAFVSKLSADGSSLVYSTFLGGGSWEGGYGLALDGAGAAYVTGFTYSSDFPLANAFDPSHNGGPYDAFASKLSADGSSLVYSSFLGGTSWDVGLGIVVDGSGAAYVAGRTGSTNFPTFSAYDVSLGGSSDVFVSKLSVDGSSLVYSTYLGGSDGEEGPDIEVNGLGAVCVAGSTDSTDFPVTAGAYDASSNGAADFFVSRLSASGSSLAYSTYLGGSGEDQLFELALNSSGSAYMAGSSDSANFPTTAGSYDSSANGGVDAVVCILCPIAEPGPISGLSTLCASSSGLAYSIAPLSGAVDYTWTVPPGSTIVSGQGTGSISVNFGALAGEVSVVANAPCPSEPRALAINFQDVAISEQPVSLSACPNGSASFHVSASGAEPLSYQWYRDNAPLAGQTAAVLTLNSISSSDLGSYHCQVSNICGSLDSDPASLTFAPLGVVVNPPGAAQGLHFLVLAGGPECGIPDYELQWTNLSTGFAYPIDQNPITLSPVLGETSTFEFRVTDGRSRATTTALVPVLVHHFDVLDWDGNGCSELADLWQAIQHWRTSYAGDPNDDGFLDIRDYLYINTDGCP